MNYTPPHHKDTPRTETLVAELNAVDHREHFRNQRLLGHARNLEREHAELMAEVEHLRMQIGYIATELMVRGDQRTLPEIVEAAAKATAPKPPKPNTAV